MKELQMGAMLFLVWNSMEDIRKKKISFVSVSIFFVLRLFHFLMQISESQKELPAAIAVFLIGAVPGILLCAVGKVSRGALGTGDGIVSIVAGLYVGIMQTVEMIMWAFFLAFFWSVAMLIFRKYKRETRFPFVPFLLTGLILSIWI